MKQLILSGLILSILLSAGKQTFAADFKSCKVFYNDGKYNAASRCFNALITKDSNDIQSRFWYAASLYYDKQFAKSYEQYNYIAEAYPDSYLGKYSQKEAQKVKAKIDYVKYSKKNDKGSYIYDIDQISKWTKMPIRVWIEPSKYTESTKQAFMQWQTKTNETVKFNFVNNQTFAQIKVTFVDKIVGGTSRHDLGLTKVRYFNNKNSYATIQILQRTDSNQYRSQKQIYYTALHEVGHALGLGGHSTNNNDIMYYNTHTNSTSLSQKDINTIKEIYKK